MKVAGESFDPLTQAAVRSVGAGVLLLSWCSLRQRSSTLTRSHFGWLGLVGLLFAAEFALYYIGMQDTSASRGVLFLYTSPFFVAVGAHFLFPNDRLTVPKSLGLVAAFLGLGLVVADEQTIGAMDLWKGDALILCAAVLWGATTLVIKASPLNAVPPERTLLAQLLVSGVLFLPAAFFMGGEARTPPQPVHWLALAYQVIGVAFLSYLVWFAMILRYDASRLAAFTFVAPASGVVFGAVLLGEDVGQNLLAGLVCISIGIWLVNRNGRRARQG